MLKLYKQIQEKIYYWQAWEHGTDVLLHWGEVGQRGEHQTIPLNAGENAEDVLLRESAPQVNQGFTEIEPVSLLAIEFVCEGTGSPADLKKSGEIEYLTNQFLGWTGNGFCDGNEIADGTLTVFCCVMDRQIAADMTIACLQAAQLLDGVKIQSIANVEDDNEVPFIHWPEAIAPAIVAEAVEAAEPVEPVEPEVVAEGVVAQAVEPAVVQETLTLPEFVATAEAEKQPNLDVEAQPIEQQQANETPNAELEKEETEEEEHEPEEPVDTRVRIDRTTYKINQTVIHDTFGKGKITNITDVNCLAVKFETAGRRLLDARHTILYAPEKKGRK